MSIEIKVSANSIEELADKLLALGSKLNSGSVLTAAASAVKSEDKPTRNRKTKEPVTDGVALQSTSHPEPETPVAEGADIASESIEEATVDVPELTFEADIAPRVVALVTAGKRGAVTDILSQFGAARASEVNPEQWPEFIALLKAAE